MFPNLGVFFAHESLQGDVVENLRRFVRECKAAAVVTDFTPLREVRKWKEAICECLLDVPIYEVDAHNVVPVWVASPKLEYSARTLRLKINKLLPEYLVEFPQLLSPTAEWKADLPVEIDWDHLIQDVVR